MRQKHVGVVKNMKVLILEKLHTKYVCNIIVLLKVCVIMIKLTLCEVESHSGEIYLTLH